ncbi:hypothetical protein GCM10027160_15190 [Streptomyces calidiresistens]|uniref:MarR family transcriptional regulator n=1 Tax=Streptomyces calidiresistens TaxID=1485586 RepID=A0A7W3T4N9_9ACTN|nr:MarR family transcriptional regulator [Streptomyces calidiresistens]MBB0230731.1 MarR family transcriptional regulator [Streptomyces calidiresistens]
MPDVTRRDPGPAALRTPSSAGRPAHTVELLTRAERLTERLVREALAGTGCSPEAWRVLVLLSDGEGHRMTAVAEHALLPPPTATRLVDHLVDEGLVHRRVDPMDRRRVLAHATPRGMERAGEVSDRVRTRWEALPDQGDDTLLRLLLTRLVAGLEAVDSGDSDTLSR